MIVSTAEVNDINKRVHRHARYNTYNRKNTRFDRLPREQNQR